MPPKIDKISLYEGRRLGATINVVFDFLRESRSPWLRFVLLPLLLMSAVQASVGGIRLEDSSMAEMLITGFAWPVPHLSDSLYTICLISGIFLTSVTTVSLVLAYHQRPQAAEGLTLRVIYPYITHTLKRVWTVIPLLTLIVVLISQSSDFAILLAIVMLVLPMMLVCPVLTFEPLPAGKAWQRALGWGYVSWGQILMLWAGMTLICFFLRSMAALPTLLVESLKDALLPSSQMADWLSTFISWSTDFLTHLVCYLTFSLLTLMYTFYYGDKAQRYRRSQVEDELNIFETLR